MLKDKNYAKAEAIVAAKPTAKLNTEQQAKLLADLHVAEKAYAEQDALVKKHYKEIYEPMCAKKAELEIRMHELRIRVDQLAASNPAADALFKLVLKQLNKS